NRRASRVPRSRRSQPRPHPSATITLGSASLEGSAGDPAAALAAAELAESRGPLSGWVNNAAVFRDATLATARLDEISRLIALNLDMTVTGCQVAVQHFLAHSRPGAIVNVSSHQAQ